MMGPLGTTSSAGVIFLTDKAIFRDTGDIGLDLIFEGRAIAISARKDDAIVYMWAVHNFGTMTRK